MSPIANVRPAMTRASVHHELATLEDARDVLTVGAESLETLGFRDLRQGRAT